MRISSHHPARIRRTGKQLRLSYTCVYLFKIITKKGHKKNRPLCAPLECCADIGRNFLEFLRCEFEFGVAE